MNISIKTIGGHRYYCAFIKQNVQPNLTEEEATIAWTKDSLRGCSFIRAETMDDLIVKGLYACGFNK